eukprot:8114363-Lingulodinium_polyedra.AAC.1
MAAGQRWGSRVVQMADNLDFASPWLLDAKSRGRAPGGGRCISAEIKIRRAPVRTTDEPEAT